MRTATSTSAAQSNHGAWWGHLWPLLATAALTLLVAYIVQFYLVPAIDQRRRREERWERDVLALGELLAFEQAGPAGRLAGETYTVAFLYETPENADPKLLAEVRAEHERAYREAREAYDAMNKRVDWLAARVIAMAPGRYSTKKLERSLQQYDVYRVGLSILVWPWHDNSPPSDDKIRTRRDKEREAAAALLDEVNKLANEPPRARLWRKRR